MKFIAEPKTGHALTEDALLILAILLCILAAL